MRIAVGVDLVDVRRLRRLLADNPNGAGAIFTAHELAYCDAKRDRYPHLAARFAAKEAFLKALGTGMRHGHHWTDIEVRNDLLGRPFVHLSGRLAADVAARGGTTELSLSHSGDYAVASVSLVLEPAPTVRRKDHHAVPSDRPDRRRRAGSVHHGTQAHLAARDLLA